MPGSRELTGSRALMSWVQDAVTSVAWPGKDDQFQGFSSSRLMVLEVYCCAKGAIGSEEMEDWIDVDPVLHEVFPHTHPKPPIIMAFRKSHRRDVLKCLSQILDIALKARFGDDDAHRVPIDYCVVRSLDAWFNPRCGPNPASEASARVEILSWTDNMSKD